MSAMTQLLKELRGHGLSNEIVGVWTSSSLVLLMLIVYEWGSNVERSILWENDIMTVTLETTINICTTANNQEERSVRGSQLELEVKSLSFYQEDDNYKLLPRGKN
jgi:hypothetical protein